MARRKIIELLLFMIRLVVWMDLFWTVAVILIVLWLLGFIVGIAGALIHLLLVIAIIVIIIRLLQGNKGKK